MYYIQFNDQTILQVEVVSRPDERELGLMYRKVLKADHGMLFDFRGKTHGAFWMKNTHLPLDIGFFGYDRCLHQVIQLKPHDTAQNRPKKPYFFALEVNRGWFAKQFKKDFDDRCFKLHTTAAYQGAPSWRFDNTLPPKPTKSHLDNAA